MTKDTALILNDMVVDWACGIYTNKKFSDLTKLSPIPHLREYQILNELLLAGEVLTIVISKFHRKGELEKKIIEAHMNFLKSLGMTMAVRKVWEKASFIRLEEYENFKNEARMAMIEFEGRKKIVDCSKVDEINFFLPQFAVATLCDKHIRNGKKDQEDKLFKLIFKRLTDLALNIHIEICGDRFDISAKVKIKILNFWENLREN